MTLPCIKKSLTVLSFIVIGGILTGLSAQNYRLPGQHTEQSKNLLANQTSSQPNTLIAPSIDYLKFDEEQEPEEDLYELGWESKLVNCYGNAVIPDQIDIDVSGYVAPHQGYITSPYGYRQRFKRMHKGVDIHVNVGDTVRAAWSGRVRLTKYEAKGYGYYVVLRHYNDLETVYGHLSKFLVKDGDYVRAGEPIALAGNTGRSTGPHLHFETRYMGYAINPMGIIDFIYHKPHIDTYAFNKKTYQEARNFSPEANAEYAKAYLQANPRRAASASSSSGSKSSTQYVTVKSGDSLSKIANRNHTTVNKLCKLNGLTTKSKIKPGQKIRVK